MDSSDKPSASNPAITITDPQLREIAAELNTWEHNKARPMKSYINTRDLLFLIQSAAQTQGLSETSKAELNRIREQTLKAVRALLTQTT